METFATLECFLVLYGLFHLVAGYMAMEAHADAAALLAIVRGR